jgi:hypothetical protein
MKPFTNNPRQLSKSQAKRLKETMQEFGDLSGIVHDLDTDEVIGGNQRSNVAALMQTEPVITERFSPALSDGTALLGYFEFQGRRFAYRAVTGWDADKRQKANLVANAGGGAWDTDLLSSIDTSVLTGVGFDTEMLLNTRSFGSALDAMLKSEEPHADAEPGVDRAEELQTKWKCERGQTWRLGNIGFLYCGDSASAKIKCDFAIYDPPYEWETRQQENALMWADWKNLLLMGLKNAMPLVLRSDFNHWWIWDTGMARFGGKGYKPMSGCAVMINFGDKRRWNDGAVSVLERHGIEHFQYPIQVVHIQDHLGGMDRQRDEKPQSLCEYIIALYSLEGDVVGDLFAGCGSFLVAAVAMKRQYRGSEILPENCAVILEKFYVLTGVLPNLVNDAE